MIMADKAALRGLSVAEFGALQDRQHEVACDARRNEFWQGFVQRVDADIARDACTVANCNRLIREWRLA